MFTLKNVKLLLIGGIAGMMVTGTSVYGAEQVKQYILTKADYPIVKGEEEYKNEELPVLNYNGNTYVPLKSLSDLIGIPVNWNADKKRVELPNNDSTSAVTAAPVTR